MVVVHQAAGSDSRPEPDDSRSPVVIVVVIARLDHHHVGIVARHIHHFGVGGLNADLLLLAGDLHLLAAAKIAGLIRFLAVLLDGFHHVGLLVGHRVSQSGGPIGGRYHGIEDLRVIDQRAHGRFPILGCVGRGLALLGQLIGLAHLGLLGRGHQHVGKHRVGIEGDGPYDLLQLFRRVELVGGLLGQAKRTQERGDQCDQEDQFSHHASYLPGRFSTGPTGLPTESTSVQPLPGSNLVISRTRASVFSPRSR